MQAGPLITGKALGKVEEHIADAGQGRAVPGRRRSALGGNFSEPTILTGVTAEMKVARRTFRPVAPLFRFETEADVIARANDTIFGLASYFYARDLGRVWRVRRRWNTAWWESIPG